MIPSSVDDICFAEGEVISEDEVIRTCITGIKTRVADIANRNESSTTSHLAAHSVNGEI